MMLLMGVILISFLSTLSLRRATHQSQAESRQTEHFYPRSPCGERHQDKVALPPAQKISIHALLAESDYITIITICIASKFLSTLSLRRATNADCNYRNVRPDFYPRSPCGERPWARGSRVTYIEFLSTLSLRRATPRVIRQPTPTGFLSTLSLRRATDNKTTQRAG